ncbi:MAG: hypothetical protein HY986_11905 [Candidatus Melainabacteria bacterium]|nr:hypothetical protein [Candidatus Melainabacteria bacterium]
MDGNHNRNIERKQESPEQTGVSDRISHETVGSLTSASQKQILADMSGNTKTASEHLPSLTIVDTGKLDTWRLSEQAAGVFNKTDKNNDQRLDLSELTAAVANPGYTGKDAQLIAALYTDRTAIEAMVKDGGSGMSLADIKAVENKASMEDVTGMLRWFNHEAKNKPYTKDELEQVIGRSDTDPNNRNGLRYLKDNFHQIAGADGAVDKEDIRRFAENTPLDGGSLHIRNTIATTYESEVKSSSLLFGKGDQLKNIVPEAVKQGDGVGDCYFMSAVAAVAGQRPEDIQNMIKANDDGSFTVTFPGTRDEPITVERPTSAEMGLYAKGTEHGIWPAVLEKAHGQYMDQHFWRRNFRQVAGGNTVQESADGAESQFSLGNGLELMTGHAVDNDVYNMDFGAWKVPTFMNGVDGARTKLQEAMQEDRAVLARFEGHVAAVRAFDANGADGGTLTIYDQDNTQSDISLKEFLKKAHSFSYEQRPVKNDIMH